MFTKSTKWIYDLLSNPIAKPRLQSTFWHGIHTALAKCDIRQKAGSHGREPVDWSLAEVIAMVADRVFILLFFSAVQLMLAREKDRGRYRNRRNAKKASLRQEKRRDAASTPIRVHLRHS
jgi:hypothetical protein